ncbi:hypothetical protein B0J13DRAFT_552615 [Dactylonectria estremocensis]|uniref:Uncharacterized protein n=1 Tax=Dactylonectria estremocensis TaxID=1079267 RepID=A0A9P9EXF2_9HYPO|nr:hypothetical protein B0J13DRAFT_552615 [Dactylonectria estremocensis]
MATPAHPSVAQPSHGQPIPLAPFPAPAQQPPAPTHPQAPSVWTRFKRWFYDDGINISNCVTALAGLVIAVVALIATFSSDQKSRDALDLAKWTARKDYLELCNEPIKGGPSPSECEAALRIELSPPPHVRISATARHVRRSVQQGCLKATEFCDRFFNNALVAYGVIVGLCGLCFAWVYLDAWLHKQTSFPPATKNRIMAWATRFHNVSFITTVIFLCILVAIRDPTVLLALCVITAFIARGTRGFGYDDSVGVSFAMAVVMDISSLGEADRVPAMSFVVMVVPVLGVFLRPPKFGIKYLKDYLIFSLSYSALWLIEKTWFPGSSIFDFSTMWGV